VHIRPSIDHGFHNLAYKLGPFVMRSTIALQQLFWSIRTKRCRLRPVFLQNLGASVRLMILKHDAAHVRFRSWAFLDDNAGEMLAKIATQKSLNRSGLCRIELESNSAHRTIKIPTTPPTARHCR
jgi:hypothetical protein